MTVRETLIAATTLLLVGFGSSALAGDAGGWAANGTATVPAFVRVTEVTAIGPDGGERVIFSRASGRLVPVMNIDRIGRHIDPAQVGAPGVYRHLKVQLANELLIFGPGHRVARTHFSSNGTGPVVDLNGQLVVADGLVDASTVSLPSGATERTGRRTMHSAPLPVRYDRHHHRRLEGDDD